MEYRKDLENRRDLEDDVIMITGLVRQTNMDLPDYKNHSTVFYSAYSCCEKAVVYLPGYDRGLRNFIEKYMVSDRVLRKNPSLYDNVEESPQLVVTLATKRELNYCNFKKGLGLTTRDMLEAIRTYLVKAVKAC